MNKLNVEEIKKYEVVGIRGLCKDESYVVGDTVRNSYDWNYEFDHSSFEDEEPVELDGACSIKTDIDTFMDDEEEILEKLEKALATLKSGYPYSEFIVIGGSDYEYGADENEIIIDDAVVLSVV